jgi:hypothetical protein
MIKPIACDPIYRRGMFDAGRPCASMAGFKSFDNAAITIAGIELARRIHKRQFLFGAGRPRRERSLKVLWDRALA